ncbi:hypothetical protein [Lysobacter sp. CA196]|uniref:hypothetical protein n=1 Tax=Lysobacter sp. CA196 TaxID=3455606 RepID=UPI003F8D8A37
MFRYILKSEHDTCFDPYFDYIAGLKGAIDEALYEFVADVGRYDLRSKGSLHDAWLRRLTLTMSEIAEHPVRQNLHMELLGPYHDRVFHLYYGDVLSYSYSQQARRRSGQQDLLVHEFRLGAQGEFEHVFEFDDGLTISIVCRSMRFEEIPLEVEAETETGPDA